MVFKQPSLTELIEHIQSSLYVYYKAPMDHRPQLVSIRRYTIDRRCPDKSKLTFWTPETLTLTVNIKQHLDRFRLEDK